MAQEFSRARRVGEQIKRELAPLLQREAREWGLGFVTLTGVDVSPDLKHARLYVTALGGAKSREELVEAISARAGIFRDRIAHGLRLRVVPRLTFAFDESIERGDRIASLLRDVPGTEPQGDPGAGE